MNITLGGPGLRVLLLRGGTPVRWRPLAKDGFDLPLFQQTPTWADQTVSIGETFDFEYTPRRPGEMRIEVRGGNGRLIVTQLVNVIE